MAAEYSSQLSIRNYASFLVRLSSGESQAVVGILLSCEDASWTVAVPPGAAPLGSRSIDTAGGVPFCTLTVAGAQLHPALQQNIEGLVEESDLEAGLEFDSWRGNPGGLLSEVCDAWAQAFSSALEDEEEYGAAPSRIARPKASAASSGSLGSFQLVDPMQVPPMDTASTVSAPGSGVMPGNAMMQILAEIRAGQIDLGARVARLEQPPYPETRLPGQDVLGSAGPPSAAARASQCLSASGLWGGGQPPAKPPGTAAASQSTGGAIFGAGGLPQVPMAASTLPTGDSRYHQQSPLPGWGRGAPVPQAGAPCRASHPCKAPGIPHSGGQPFMPAFQQAPAQAGAQAWGPTQAATAAQEFRLEEESSADSIEGYEANAPPLVAEYQQKRSEERRHAPLFQAGMGQVDPAMQVQMEMLRTLQDMRRKHGHDSLDEDDVNDDEYLRKTRTGGIAELHSLRRRFRERPLDSVMAYRQRVMRKLGVSIFDGGIASAPWQHTDFSHKIKPQFGKMSGLWRIHFALGKCLSLAEEKKSELLAGTLVQTLKAIHQVAIDSGNWSNAVLLLPWQDPLARELWAGEDAEMATAARYSRAIKDLSLKVQVSDGLADEGLQGGEPAHRPPKGARNPRGPKAGDGKGDGKGA